MWLIRYYTIGLYYTITDPQLISTDDLKRSYAYALDSVLISCMFDMHECTAEDFEWYWDKFYGNCYRFNGGKNANGDKIPYRMIGKSGDLCGLSLELYAGPADNGSPFKISSGFRVIIFNSTYFPPSLQGTLLKP